MIQPRYCAFWNHKTGLMVWIFLKVLSIDMTKICYLYRTSVLCAKCERARQYRFRGRGPDPRVQKYIIPCSAPEKSSWELWFRADTTTLPLLFSVMNIGVLVKDLLFLVRVCWLRQQSCIKSVLVGHFGWGKHNRYIHSD